MAKGGGAGKVYFVLYLAVILELLIIIVERDEAEENLIRRQKETMRIVESILAQLQIGSGTEGISTRPQDEITLQEVKISEGPEIKQWRKYFIEVGVTDVAAAAAQLDPESENYEEELRKLIRLGNVEELEYEVFYHPSNSPDPPYFPPDDSLRHVEFTQLNQPVGPVVDKGQWRLVFLRKVQLDIDQTKDWRHPVYKYYVKEVGSERDFAPDFAVKHDSVFVYSEQETQRLAQLEGGRIRKRAFLVYFKPPNKPGWYKLRFVSRTNRILGVTGDVASPEELPPDFTVNIGTVKLKIKDLRVVQKELQRSLSALNLPGAEELAEGKLSIEDFDKFLEEAKQKVINGEINLGMDPAAVTNKLDLYGYIVKLLTPNASRYFEQNRQSYQIDIRVVKPPITIAEPYVELPEAIYTFDAVPVVFTFASGPFQGNNYPTGEIVDPATLQTYPLSIEPIDQQATTQPTTPGAAKGGKRWYRARTAEPLKPGTYQIRITQTNMGKSTVGETPLEVFETGLEEENRKEVEFHLRNMLYGYVLSLHFKPKSGGKIPAKQFKIYARYDNDPQTPPVRGLDLKVPLPAKANTLSLKLVWEHPFTGEEIDILPELKREIKQEPPYFQLQNISFSQPEQLSGGKVRISARNIDIIMPYIDTAGKQATIKDVQDLGVQNIQAEVEGFEVDEAIVEDQGNQKLKVDIILKGKIPSGQRSVSGNVNVTIGARVRNPINGKLSEMGLANITIPVELEKRRRGRLRRR